MELNFIPVTNFNYNAKRIIFFNRNIQDKWTIDHISVLILYDFLSKKQIDIDTLISRKPCPSIFHQFYFHLLSFNFLIKNMKNKLFILN